MYKSVIYDNNNIKGWGIGIGANFLYMMETKLKLIQTSLL